MADISYPCSLPGVLIASFGISEDPHFRSNPTQSGPPINELLTDFTSAPVSVSWSFNTLEYQAFDAWFKYVINLGTTPFNLFLPVGAGLVEHECQFSGRVQKSLNGRRNHLSATLIAKELVYQDECSALDLLKLMELVDPGCKDQCDLLMEFNDFANITLPDAWEGLTDRLGTDYS